MFTPRTTPVAEGTKPYAWNVPSVYECTWYCFYRCQEALNCSPPTYWDRETKTGSYTNAKEWLKNFREPWEVKGTDYTPKAGDIAVFDGQYGHVQFMETDTMYSEYSNGNEGSFANGLFTKKSNLLGFLHYPLSTVQPVERNVSVDQIQTMNESLRIRTKPSLSGEIVGYVQKGYYNVLDTKKADGYEWYKIANNRWCANVETVFLPSNNTDIIEEIERYINSIKDRINVLSEENEELKYDMKEIEQISKRWTT